MILSSGLRVSSQDYQPIGRDPSRLRMPIRIPENVASKLADAESLCWTDSYNPDGSVNWTGEIGLCPPGFLPWGRFEIGNGDVFGYYWPIGREGESPIVCLTYHDAWSAIPLSSSLESLIALQLATSDRDIDQLS